MSGLLAGWLVRCAAKLVWVGLGLVLIAALGLPRVALRNDLPSFFGADNPEITNLEKVRSILTEDGLLLLVLYQPGDGNVFSPTSLQRLAALEAGLRGFAAVREVHSLLDQRLLVERGGLGADSAMAERFGTVAWLDAKTRLAEKADLRALALATPTIKGVSVDAAGTYAALQVVVRRTDDRTDERQVAALAAAIERRAESWIDVAGGDRLLQVGLELFGREGQRILGADAMRLVPATLAITALLLLLALRSLAMVAIVMLLLGATFVTSLGLAGWLGLPLSALAGAAALSIGTLALADVIHVLCSWRAQRSVGYTTAAALCHSLGVNAMPMLLTSLTTIIGYGSFAWSASPAIRGMGLLIALGVSVALLLTLLLVPGLLLWLDRRPALAAGPSWIAWPSRLGVAAWQHPRLALLVLFGCALCVLPGVLALQQRENLLGWFGAKTAFGQALMVSSDRLVTIGALTALVEATDEDYAALLRHGPAAEALPLARPLSQELAQLASAARVLGPPEAVQAFLANRPRVTTLPGADVRPLAWRDFATAGLAAPLAPGHRPYLAWHAAVPSLDWVRIRETRARMARLVDGPPQRRLLVGGSALVTAQFAASNTADQLLGLAATLATIIVMCALVFRRGQLLLAAIAAYLLPLWLVAGIWGGFGQALDTALLAGLTASAGLVIDDIIHLLVKIRAANHGRTLTAAGVLRGLQEATPGVTVTSMVLVGGFACIATSELALAARIALVVMAVLAVSLPLVLLVIPAWLALWRQPAEAMIISKGSPS